MKSLQEWPHLLIPLDTGCVDKDDLKTIESLSGKLLWEWEEGFKDPEDEYGQTCWDDRSDGELRFRAGVGLNEGNEMSRDATCEVALYRQLNGVLPGVSIGIDELGSEENTHSIVREDLEQGLGHSVSYQEVRKIIEDRMEELGFVLVDDLEDEDPIP
jgi:hypothetical protein